MNSPTEGGKRLLVAVGILAIGVAVMVTFYPALKIGFWGDDFHYLEYAGRLSSSEYLALYFDPRHLLSEFRPLRGIQWAIEYAFFRGEPVEYHLIQNLLHLANSLLLYLLLRQVSRNWRLGLIAGLIYATWPIYGEAVYLLNVPDPLATLFYLLTIWMWIRYLERGGWKQLALAWVAFVLALLSKEIAVTLPIVLLLVDRFLIRQTVPWRTWVKRNAIFFSFLPIYALFESNILIHRFWTESTTLAIPANIIANLFQFLRLLAFPWQVDQLVQYLSLLVIFLLVVYSLIKRRYIVPFLTAAAVLNILPVLVGGGWGGWGTRYLYLPFMASAIGTGMLLELLLKALAAHPLSIQLSRWPRGVVALMITLAMLTNGLAIAEATENLGSFARQSRLQFRPIFQSYATFTPGTLLYFINSPIPTYNLSGFLFLHYGPNIEVTSPDNTAISELIKHKSVIVFYFDDTGMVHEQEVSPHTNVQTTPSLPVSFQEGIFLDRLELVSPIGKRGAVIILMPYWHTTRKIDKDYTVFAHLIDQDENMISSYDRQPQQGGWPTSRWEQNRQVTDMIILPIDPATPIGEDYQIELGLYYLQTMQRLFIVDANSTPATHKVTIGPFSVVP